MIDLDPAALQQLREILRRQLPGCEVRLFGSRVRGTARRFSDIDLALVGSAPLPAAELTRLRDEFAESDLPYRVDVVDWRAISPEFRRTVEEQGFEVIQQPSV